MTDIITVETLLQQAQALSAADKLRLLEGLAFALRHDLPTTQPYARLSLRETYGILADDPIERPPQLPLEEREPLE